jgi:hypothetical protein
MAAFYSIFLRDRVYAIVALTITRFSTMIIVTGVVLSTLYFL